MALEELFSQGLRDSWRRRFEAREEGCTRGIVDLAVEDFLLRSESNGKESYATRLSIDSYTT